jgi:hypothetical protein
MSEALTAIRALSGLPASKEDQKRYAQKLKEELLSGNVPPLQAHIFIKSILSTIQDVIDDKEVKEYVMDEVRKYGEKSFDAYGAKVTVANKPTYDYSSCGDSVYNDLIDQMNKVKEQIKIREALLKTGSDPATGEVFKPYQVKDSEYITIKIL